MLLFLANLRWGNNWIEKQTALLLCLDKYGGYIAVFWVAINNAGLVIPGSLLPLFLVFSLDSIGGY